MYLEPELVVVAAVAVVALLVVVARPRPFVVARLAYVVARVVRRDPTLSASARLYERPYPFYERLLEFWPVDA